MKTFRQLINEDLPPKSGDDLVMNPNQSELQEENSHAATLLDHITGWKFFDDIEKENYTGNGLEAIVKGNDGFKYSITIRVSK